MDEYNSSELLEEIEEIPDDGPWGLIVRSKERISYWPRDKSKLARFEWILPSGRLLIEDVGAGLVVRRVYSIRFDMANLRPIGRSLGDRMAMRMQAENEPWFVSCYQDVYDSNDQLVSSDLMLVEEHLGRARVQRYEFG